MKRYTQIEAAYEDAIAPQYDHCYYGAPVPISHLKSFCKMIRQYAGRNDRMLDLGCGTGAVSAQLHKNGFNRLVSADLSLAMIQEAKSKLPHLLAVVCDAEHLPFKSETFDVIVCSSVLHHLPFPDLVLQEVHRGLSTYGLVIAQEPNESPFLVSQDGAQAGDRALSLMHYLYRVERHRPLAEPPVHEFHRAFRSQELMDLFRKQFFVLRFESRFGFSHVFGKLKSRVMSQAILSLDRTLRHYPGAVFHVVGGKSDAGHTQLLKEYLHWVDATAKQPDKLPILFILCLFPVILLARVYEFSLRVSAKCGAWLARR